LILAGAFLLTKNPTLGLSLALVGGLGVAAKFVPDYFNKGHAIWPAGVLGILGTISVIVGIMGFIKK
jgi:hypothetical protein